MNSSRSFYSHHPVVKFTKGETILQQDESPKCVYAVKSGVVEVVNFIHSGESRSIAFKITDDLFPLEWAFSKTKHSLFYYQAYTDCELYTIGHKDFQDRLKSDGNFTQSILDRQMNGYVGMSLQVDALNKTTAYDKLIYMFRCLCLRYGHEMNKNLVEIQIPLTQQKLANLIGASRETTTMELGKLKTKGIISSHSKCYLVDTSKINDQIDDGYNPGTQLSML